MVEILDSWAKEDLIEKVILQYRHTEVRENSPGRGNCMCNGPVMGVSVVCWKNRKEASVLAAE